MKPRALVIEDRLEMAVMYIRALEAAGFEAFTAINLTEAYEFLSLIPPPDVVFLDLNLNETETAQYTVLQIPKIKAFNPSMVVIVISGVLTPDLTRIASLQGAADAKEKLDMKTQVDLWNVLNQALNNAPSDLQSRLANISTFFKSAAHKLSLL